MEINNIFNNLNETATPVVETPVAKETAGNGTDRVKAMKEAMKETTVVDPSFDEKLQKYSSHLEVINSLGFGDSGNLLFDKDNFDPNNINPKTGKPVRPLTPTSTVVGYRVRNNGEEAIKYTTEVWTKGADGKFVATKTEKVLAQGEVADLPRQYMTALCAIPEISFTLANGKIIKGSGAKGDKSLKAELESYYFKFNPSEDGTTKQINDDDVKLNISEKVGDKWVVKAEYEETFGFLNNQDEVKKKGKAKSKYTSQDYAANYINKLISEQGL